jgi:hypothetical protein
MEQTINTLQNTVHYWESDANENPSHELMNHKRINALNKEINVMIKQYRKLTTTYATDSNGDISDLFEHPSQQGRIGFGFTADSFPAGHEKIKHLLHSLNTPVGAAMTAYCMSPL